MSSLTSRFALKICFSCPLTLHRQVYNMSLSKWGNSRIKEPFVILATLWWHILCSEDWTVFFLFHFFSHIFHFWFCTVIWNETWPPSFQTLWVFWAFSEHTYSIKTYCTVTTFLYTTPLREILNLIEPIAMQCIWTSKHFAYFPVSSLSRPIMEITKPSIISRVFSSLFYLLVDIL